MLRISARFLLLLVVVVGERGAGGSSVRARVRVTLSAWMSVQFAWGSAFYDLTVAKDRGPYEGN